MAAALSSAFPLPAPNHCGVRVRRPTPPLPRPTPVLNSRNAEAIFLALHRLEPRPRQQPTQSVHHQEQVGPLVGQLHTLAHLHSTHSPYATGSPPEDPLASRRQTRWESHDSPQPAGGLAQGPLFPCGLLFQVRFRVQWPRRLGRTSQTPEAARRFPPSCSERNTPTLSNP